MRVKFTPFPLPLQIDWTHSVAFLLMTNSINNRIFTSSSSSTPLDTLKIRRYIFFSTIQINPPLKGIYYRYVVSQHIRIKVFTEKKSSPTALQPLSHRLTYTHNLHTNTLTRLSTGTYNSFFPQQPCFQPIQSPFTLFSSHFIFIFSLTNLKATCRTNQTISGCVRFLTNPLTNVDYHQWFPNASALLAPAAHHSHMYAESKRNAWTDQYFSSL